MGKASTSVAIAEADKPRRTTFRYYALFFASGFPALIYQIIWQRALFTIYGVNVQSVTVIVTVFMLGLGIGSLIGGRISASQSINVLRVFGLIELGIGTFGACSLLLFHFVQQFTSGASTAAVAVISFALLLVPTLLMGSTLPLLVEHLVRRTDNVGESVGSLYSVNTLGSSVACFLSSMLLMRCLGQSGCVHLAVVINIVVGSTSLLLSFHESPQRRTSGIGSSRGSSKDRYAFSMAVGMILAGATGFLALAYEILWYHIYSYASGGKASCFARLLGFYLLGIAYGSLAVHDLRKETLKNDTPRTVRSAAVVVAIGAIVAFSVAPAASFCIETGRIPYDLTFVFVAVGAALLGAAFPLISHASIPPDGNAGRKLSYLYVSNIIGSALGSYTIGFVAMDHMSTAQISLLLLSIGLITSAALVSLARPLLISRLLLGTFAAALVLVVFSHSLFSGLFERLMLRVYDQRGIVFRDLVENRSGIITVDSDETVYGGGIYDGEFRIEPLDDRDNIFRAFAVGAMHPHPERVLVIGLASGSWTQVLVNLSGVEDTQIIEINPGYLPLIEKRPIVASLLKNPRVHVDIDDGRRWLLSHPDSKFDFILMNTTFNWRANTTNLLSVEFLRMVRSHLNPGGILYYNTTSSSRVQVTGATVFPYALRIANFIAVSDSPISFDRTAWRKILENYKLDGRPIFDLSRVADRACINRWVSMPESQEKSIPGHLDASIEDRKSLLSRYKGERLITDDNMGTEW